MNLINNAFKFTKDGSVTVTTKVTQLETDNVILSFEITDTGIGISEDKLETVFESFFTRICGNQPQIWRKGLGLTIVKKTNCTRRRNKAAKYPRTRFYFLLTCNLK
jgi:signal transduction histidine kinase